MKTLILQGDGIAGLPSPELEGRTPLQVASTPGLDFLAGHGEYGVLELPNDASDLSGAMIHLALLGYDSRKYYTGPGPFAGTHMEVVLGTQDVAFLCSLVTLGSRTGRADGKKLGPQVVMEDDTSGGIGTEEARELIGAINEQIGSETIQFYAGNAHRHLMVWVGGTTRVICHDPHMALGQVVSAYLPVGDGSVVVKELMEASRVVLRDHPINRERENAGLKPANCLWLWGPGKTVDLPKMTERYGISGAMVSNSDLHLGIGLRAGLEAIDASQDPNAGESVFMKYPQVTETLFRRYDLVYLHIEEKPNSSPGYVKEKVKRIEEFDQRLVSRLLESLPTFGDYRVVVVCNHWSPLSEGSGAQPTPFTLFESTNLKSIGYAVQYSEVEAGASPIGARDATRILDRLFAKARVS